LQAEADHHGLIVRGDNDADWLGHVPPPSSQARFTPKGAPQGSN